MQPCPSKRARYSRCVARVSIEDLRTRAGKVIDRAARGELIMITRSGKAVAELRPLRSGLSAEALLARRRRLPAVDPAALREDIDRPLDTRL
jgi:prevent-host-death family protein